MAGEIVIGYDSSDCAREALRVALELARGLGVAIVVVYADQPPDRLRGEEWHEHRRALHEIGLEVTRRALDEAEAAGVEAEAAIVPERPVDALLATATERGARLIVVGTYGEGPIAGAILGSVPYKLLHRARVPVLVVPTAAS
ncbi:MAG: universal stress protein [Thermoleophilia bacterium]|nr:universal stress protein [Thermoleophilia bacterium]